ncbi:hypothetical protein OS493_012921 [Desmophyllum pertusum]|uniref:Uncharacterized protein n=1 Tax=Desmophyllum pertusum TaxID=174260 RepID=A0A9W9Z1N8_9CNID|nr:hypothetical protein OS493_012921 [Desmophyllum pertusum]
MSGKRPKKSDSGILSIKKFFKSAENSSPSSRGPRETLEGSSRQETESTFVRALLYRLLSWNTVTLHLQVVARNGQCQLQLSLTSKHNLKGSRSKSDVWNVSPSVRLRLEAVQDHLTTTQHKDAIRLEMLQRISTFQKQENEKNEVNESML